MKISHLLYLPLLLFLFSCNAAKKASDQTTTDLQVLKKLMTGSFNSADQAAADSTYFDITLHMYPIWEGEQGDWLYVEQAVTSNQAKPYRQRVYELTTNGEGVFASKVYLMNDPEKYIGAWQKKDGFRDLKMTDIALKEGCAVHLKKQPDGTFSGATGEKSCPSELRGASYATSKVSVFPGKIVSWDQGFNGAGEQVWGATEGGYVFKKIKK
ncbi:MAG: chromophore lyase CpcT/CpeT [Bacteroidota bacterium]